jgi:dienelactone hydrolase
MANSPLKSFVQSVGFKGLPLSHRVRPFYTHALIFLIGLIACPAMAEPTARTQIIASERLDNNGKPVQIPLVAYSGAQTTKAVLLVLPSLKKPVPDILDGAEIYEPAHFPLRRSQKALVEAGFTLAWMGWPSESQFGISGLKHPDFSRDISTVIEKARQQWPSVPLLLTSTDSASTAVLSYALKNKSKIDGLLTFAPAWAQDRELAIEKLQGLPGLVLHDASGECLTVSKVEIEELSTRAGFERMPVPSAIRPVLGRCTSESAHWMPALDAQLPAVLNAWLNKMPQAVARQDGQATPALTERVLMIDSASGKIEMSILTPTGPGPFPLVVFNHGDVEMDTAWVKYKQRYRDPVLSGAFLRWGFAVVFPARPGVGRSEGIYRFANYAINDADASYKARQHAQVIQKALDRLRMETDLNADQILLAGQSAGGDAVMYMSTMALPGVKAVLNFSGGRPNHAQGQNPTFENKMMIEGWRELGGKAQVPAMLIFAENDSRYTANTIRKSAAAFNEAGGQSELLLLPPIQGDGHYVYQNPRLWSRQAWEFVRKRQLGKDSSEMLSSSGSDTPSKATTQSHPELFDLQRLPVQSESCKDIYLRFLNAPLPRFFAVGMKGRGCGYSSVAENSADKAMKFCEDRAGTCRLYAKDNELISPEPR